MRIFKKIIIIFFSLCFALGVAFFFVILNPTKDLTKVNDATVSFFHHKICDSRETSIMVVPISEGKYFFIDIGAEKSAVFSDRLKLNSSFVRIHLVNGQRLLSARRVDAIQIGDLLIENHNFIFMRAENTVFESDTIIVGIIGMDILSRKYSFFDIENQTITFSDKKKENQTENFSLVLSYGYKRATNLPFLEYLDVNGAVFENVLFDTGFNGFLELLKKDKEKIDEQEFQIKSISIAHGLLNEQPPAYRTKFDTLSINGIDFQSQTVFFGERIRLLGMEFVKQWSSFSIDPFEKKIEFFK